MRTALLRFLTILLAFGALGATGQAPAAQAASSWLPSQQIDPSDGVIYGVSCTSAAFCVAAGENGAIAQINGQRPNAPIPFYAAGVKDEATAVSCAPGTTFCMVTDDEGNIGPYASGAFGTPVPVSGGVKFNSISCATSSFCMALDTDGRLWEYTAAGWGATPSKALSAQAPWDFSAVSCTSASFCMAVFPNTGGAASYGWATWNGSTWSVGSGADPVETAGVNVSSLDCLSSSECVTSDGNGDALIYNTAAVTMSHPSPWTLTHVYDNSGGRSYAACSDTSHCMIVDSTGRTAWTANGGASWSTDDVEDDEDQTDSFYGVSCPAADVCVGVVGGGDEWTWAPPVSFSAKPVLSATSTTVGSTVTLTPASGPGSDVGVAVEWYRDDNNEGDCQQGTLVSTSASPYTTTAADTDGYLQACQVASVGMDVEDPVASNAIGPITSASSGGGGSGGGSGAGTKGGGSGNGSSGSGGSGGGGSGGGGTDTGGGDSGGSSSGGGGASTGGGSTGAPNGGTPTQPGVTLGRITVKSSTAKVPVSCPTRSSAACRVTIALTTTEKVGRHSKTVTLAHTMLTLKPGAARTVMLSLNATGRRLLTRARRLSVRLTVTQAGRRSAGATVLFRAR